MAAVGQAANAAAPRTPVCRRFHNLPSSPGVAEFHPTACEGPPRRPLRTQTKQSGAIGTASGTRLDRDSLLKQATAGRMWIQFAADAEWPHTDPANHPIRREFQLPATTPYITAMKPPITPGETFLEEYLRPMRISQNAMARAIGGPPRTVNEIVLGKRAITPAMSIRFGAFFGQSDTFWHGSQGEYNFRSLARKRKQLVSGNPPATST